MEQDALLELAEVSYTDARHYSVEDLSSRLLAAVEHSNLLLVRTSQRMPQAVWSTAGQSAWVAAIMGTGADLMVEGESYRVADAFSAWHGGYSPVPARQAEFIVSRMAGNPTLSLAQRSALAKALPLFAASAARGSGLVLLRRVVGGFASRQQAEREPALAPSQLLAARVKRDISLKFVQAVNGQPLAGVDLELVAPDGSESKVTTSSSGIVQLSGLEPGSCRVTSIVTRATVTASFVPSGGSGPPPAKAGASSAPSGASQRQAWLVRTDSYRVKTGDTPDSIAQDTGVSWNDIARFNFGTTDDAQLQPLLRDRVGCTRMSADGKRYVFHDEDDPGILLVPRAWEATFTVGTAHTVVVAPIRRVHISLENEAGIRIPGAAFNVQFADGTSRQGQLGRSGIACLTGIPEGAYSVSYPDHEDVLARSLAASTRRAFDQQATGPLFCLLGQQQSVVDKAIDCYEHYFNDLSGKGFAADIDQVVTDPDARVPLIFLCALAGVEIEGSANVQVEELEAGA